MTSTERPPDPADAADPDGDRRALLRRVALGAMVGNVVEWFDFAVFGCVAVALSANFFPASSPTAGLLQTFAVFAVAFVLRPVGGLVLGPLGDRLGRRRMLSLTVLLIAGSTALVGLLPTYGQIGIAAPLLLLLARMVQGFSVGGEYAGACSYLLEHAPDGRRGRYASLLTLSATGGFALATLIALTMSATTSTAEFTEWGWRVPFLVAAPLGVLGFYIRYRLDESPVFEQLPQPDRAPAREVLRHHLPVVLRLAGVASAAAVSFYTVTTYMTTYLQVVDGVDRTQVLLISVVVLLLGAAGGPVVGLLSDRGGRRRVALAAAVALVVVSVPGFLLASTGIVALMVLGQLLILLANIGLLVSTSAMLVELFPTRVRYTAGALAYNAGMSLFGGSAPFVATALVSLTGERLAPAYWLIAIGLLGGACAFVLPDTGGRVLTEEPEVRDRSVVIGTTNGPELDTNGPVKHA